MSVQGRSHLWLAIAFFLMAVIWAAWARPLAAQGIIIDPPPVDWPPVEPLPPLFQPITIDEHRVAALIDGPVANVRVTQVFRNESSQTVEGVYLFPLPVNATVSDFQMTVNGQTLEGKLLNKEEARRIYEAIVRQRRDPALLEYIGRNVFQTSLFPIPPGESRTLVLTYTQVLNQQAGLFEFVYPLRAQQYGAPSIKALAITVELRNQPGLRTVYSPNFSINIDRTDDTGARIGYEASAVQPTSDFKLYFGVDQEAVGLNLLSYKPAGEDGFFLLLAAPGVEVDPQAVVARDLLFVVDVSGSMQGEKIKQTQQAAHFLVDQLHPEDRFNLISFSTGVRLWQTGLQPVDEATRQDAHSWIDQLAATGSTDINRALLEGLGQLSASRTTERPAYILFLTDGLPTMGEVDPTQILVNVQNNLPAVKTLRLFTFGVGYDVNTDLLDELSRELGGRSSYVQADERIDEQVSQLYSSISTPLLVDLALSFGSHVVVDEVYPYPLPDLFAGDQLVVVGRYRTGGKVAVQLSGTVNGQSIIYQFPGQPLVGSGGEPQVARLWATRKIGALLAQVRRTGANQELIDELVELSLQYGIVTPYTSYLVIEPPELLGQAPGAVPQVELRAQAETEVAMKVQVAADADASGAAAVAASETRNELINAQTLQETGGVRYVNGKTFTRQGMIERADGQRVEFWVDTLYRAGMKLETVSFGSERYFALARQPALALWLAVSPEVLIVIKPGQAIRVTSE